MTLHPSTGVGTASRAIIEACAEAYGSTYDDVISKSRKAEHVSARHAAAWLLYYQLPLSLENVGLILGGRDHSSICHALRCVQVWYETSYSSAHILTGVARELFGQAATLPGMPPERTPIGWPIQDKARGERAAQARAEARPPTLFENDTLAQFALDAARTARRNGNHRARRKRVVPDGGKALGPDPFKMKYGSGPGVQFHTSTNSHRGVTRHLLRESRGNDLPVLVRRRELGLSFYDLSRLTGLTVSVLSRIETAQITPAGDLAETVATALGTTVDKLFGGRDIDGVETEETT